MDGLIALALAKKSSTASLNGSGAPSASLTAKKGDLYLDSTDNQLYVCTNYVNPNVSDLTGLTITFNDILPEADFTTYEGSFKVNFTDGSNAETQLEVREDMSTLQVGGQASGAAYVGWCISQGYNPWTMSNMKTITFSGGVDITNTKLINFILRNATIQGTGSTWKSLDSGLPEIDSSDEGKVPVVDSSGQWALGNTEGNTTHEGTGAPSSIMVAKVGDLYIDTTSEDVYTCVRYVDLNNITDLTGLTVVFKNTSYDRTKLAQGQTSVNFECNNTVYNKMNNLYDWGQLYYGDTNVNNFQGWLNQVYRTVTFTGGTGATDANFISWVISFADSISGAGSTWVKITDVPELPSEVAPEMYVYGCDNTSGTPVYGWYSLSNLIDNYFINKANVDDSSAEGTQVYEWSVIKNNGIQAKFTKALVPPPSNE